MSATCNDMAQKLLDYLYGELASDDRSVVEHHLAGCARCQLELDQFGHVRNAARELALIEPPAAVSSKLLFEAARQAPRHGGGGKVLPFVRRMWRHPAYAMAASFVAVAGITGWQLMQRGNVELAAPQVTTKSAQEPTPVATLPAPSAAQPSAPVPKAEAPNVAPARPADVAVERDLKRADSRATPSKMDAIEGGTVAKDRPKATASTTKLLDSPQDQLDDLLVENEPRYVDKGSGANAAASTSKKPLGIEKRPPSPPGVLNTAPPPTPAARSGRTASAAIDEDAAIDQAVREAAATISPLGKAATRSALPAEQQQRTQEIPVSRNENQQLAADTPGPRKRTPSRRDSNAYSGPAAAPAPASQNLAGLETPRNQVQGATGDDGAPESSAGSFEENAQQAKTEIDSKNDDPRCRQVELRLQTAQLGNLSPDDLWTDYLCLKRRGQGRSRRARQNLERLASEFPSYRPTQVTEENAYLGPVERQLKRVKAKAKSTTDLNK